MTGEGEDVDVHPSHVDRDDTGRLRGVDAERHTGRALLGDFGLAQRSDTIDAGPVFGVSTLVEAVRFVTRTIALEAVAPARSDDSGREADAFRDLRATGSPLGGLPVLRDSLVCCP